MAQFSSSISSRGLAKLVLDNQVPNRSGPFPSCKAYFLDSHKLVYPLDPSHLVAPPLMDWAILPLIVPAKKPSS